jgi:hypothetical protein
MAMQLIAPDLAAQQNQLARRQQMADLLRKQALAPDTGTQVVSGWAVRKSPIESLSKLAQALAGGYLQDDVDKDTLDLSKQFSSKLSDTFDKMSGVPQASAPAPASPSEASPQPSDQPQTSGSGQVSDPSAPTSAPGSITQPANLPAPSSSQGADPVSRIRNQARAAWLMGNTDLANKLLENISTLTNEQKNMGAMGQDPMEIGRLDIAKRRKEGMIELQPGATSIDLLTGEERFAPKVGEGITLHNGVASPIPGYADANAAIAGANAGAVSNANAQNEMVTVNTPNGPVMMTKAQAVQLSGGGAPKVASGLDLSRLTPEQQASLAQKDPEAFANGVQDFKRTSSAIAQGAQQAPGIPLQDEGASSFNKELNQKGAQSLLDNRDKARAANDELSSIYESRNAIKQGVYQGFGADFKTDAIKIARGFGIPVDDSQASNTDYLRSTLGKAMLDNAKKLGVNPTDADARRLDVIIGTIGKDPQAMAKLLDWREEQASKIIDNYNRDVDSALQSGSKFPFDLRVNKNQDKYAQPTQSGNGKVLTYDPSTGGFK